MAQLLIALGRQPGQVDLPCRFSVKLPAFARNKRDSVPATSLLRVMFSSSHDQPPTSTSGLS